MEGKGEGRDNLDLIELPLHGFVRYVDYYAGQDNLCEPSNWG
jgi:hypothetical protein